MLFAIKMDVLRGKDNHTFMRRPRVQNDTVLCQGFRIRDKETESPYLIHPLTYRQVYLTKYAYFGEKIHCVLEKMP